MSPLNKARRLLFLLLLASGCVREKPTLIVPPTPIGDGGRLIRELFRSGWTPPGSDGELIRVGIVPSQKRIRFRTLAPMRIRAYSESYSWEVASPEGVIWRAEAGPVVRPPVVAHFATVQKTLLRPTERPPAADLPLWRNRGYLSARWIGPHPLGNRRSREPLERWFLTLTPPTGKESAAAVCSRVRERFKSSCQVIARVELPPISLGLLSAENGTFSKAFLGFLELLSPEAPVEVFDFLAEERNGGPSKERYGPRLFVIPNLEGELSLVQSTSLANYLEGVVAAEIYADAPLAALQSQAVVARTYALRHFKADHSGRPFLICASTNCQVYRGITTPREGPSSAVRATHNLVLREPSGSLAETFYHSICGGHTEPGETVMGITNRPYLRGVSDGLPGSPFAPLRSDAEVATYLDAPSPSFCGEASLLQKDRWRWSRRLSGQTLPELAADAGLAPPLTDIVVKTRGLSGRALQLEVRNSTAAKTIDGELAIRQLLGGLPSSLFIVETAKNGNEIHALLMRGAGFGHGAGLCQMGAIGRAEKGQTFEEILNAYYPGTRLAPLEKGVVR